MLKQYSKSKIFLGTPIIINAFDCQYQLFYVLHDQLPLSVTFISFGILVSATFKILVKLQYNIFQETIFRVCNMFNNVLDHLVG
ncbi:hypothetical protein XELAEV_18026877mg [Xenopus laevis]|uniref:Uncharacterized protein n=1 Tax=Xenopus laevis TaxID=8355 RepID=A0A974HJR6_XENLA|nr:hypothetical protein XELAEV_18026877mg [Xenopus laevis]